MISLTTTENGSVRLDTRFKMAPPEYWFEVTTSKPGDYSRWEFKDFGEAVAFYNARAIEIGGR